MYRPGWWLWRWITVHIFWGTLMTLALLYFLSYFFCLLCLHFVVDIGTYSLLKGLILMMHRLATVDLKSLARVRSPHRIPCAHKTPMLLMID